MPLSISDFTETNSANKLQQTARWWGLKGVEQAQAITAVVNTIAMADSRRQTQMQISSRLYGNATLMSINGLSFSRVASSQNALKDRISYNIIQSAIDTVTAKMVKSKPKPLFLTAGGNWKMQRRAEKLNKFIDGIFYENKAYELGRIIFRDGGVLGDGLVHVFEEHGRVKYERVLSSEIFVDQMEAFYGDPRQMHRVKIVDREVLIDLFPEHKMDILQANNAKTDMAGTYQTVANQVAVMESWHLPSGPEAKDGRHVICLENAILISEQWDKKRFPFARFQWTPRLFGYWSQGAAEQIQNIQLEINKLLWVIQRAMHMAGTFKILAERGAKIVKEHFTNDFGVILEYTGTPPEYIIPPIVPPEIYSHLQTLKGQGFESVGVSMLSATAQKPAGLNAGKALREYQNIETERFQTIGQQYESFYLDLTDLSVDVVKDIFEKSGKDNRGRSYRVKVPGKKFLETIDWKDVKLEDDEYVQKIFPVSSLPNDPAGRLQTVQEYVQAGYISPRGGRRLLDFPDLEQAEMMANAGEDWLHEVLEKMIDDGVPYTPEPDDNLQLAQELVLQYLPYAKSCKVEDDRIQLLRDFLGAVNAMIGVASASQQQQAAATGMGAPQAPALPPQPSDLVPNAPGAAA